MSDRLKEAERLIREVLESGRLYQSLECDTCNGSGFRTIHGGGSGDPEWDADDQPCPECNEDYSRVSLAEDCRHDWVCSENNDIAWCKKCDIERTQQHINDELACGGQAAKS